MKTLFKYLFLFSATRLFSQDVNLLTDSLFFCVGDSAFVEIKANYDSYSSIYWTTPNGIITNTSKVNSNKTGKYYVKAYSAYFAKQLSDSIYVKIIPKPRSAIKDTVLCKNRTLQLNAKNEGSYYLWSTGDHTQKINLAQAGTYWVKISNRNCSLTDTFRVKLLNGSNAQLTRTVSFCLNEQNKVVTLKANPGTKIFWNTGATTASIAINKEGTYWVSSELNNCGKQIDSVEVTLKVCECEVMVPNSFTPNEDNRNDYFFPVMECEYTYYCISITDRWGNDVFYSCQQGAKWDGRFKGNLCPEDVYVYKIESIEKGTDKKQVRNGHVSLFR